MIDLAKEFREFVDEKHWDHVIIRYLQPVLCYCRVSRDSNCQPTGISGVEFPPDADCGNCEGTGWKFTEAVVKVKTFYTPRMVAHAQAHEHGITYKNILVAYCSASELNDDIKINDRLFQLKTNLDGTVIDPLIRSREWVVTDVYDMNMDSGKREFIKIHAKPVLT